MPDGQKASTRSSEAHAAFQAASAVGAIGGARSRRCDVRVGRKVAGDLTRGACSSRRRTIRVSVGIMRPRLGQFTGALHAEVRRHGNHVARRVDSAWSSCTPWTGRSSVIGLPTAPRHTRAIVRGEVGSTIHAAAKSVQRLSAARTGAVGRGRQTQEHPLEDDSGGTDRRRAARYEASGGLRRYGRCPVAEAASASKPVGS